MKQFITVGRYIGTRGNSLEDCIQARVMITREAHSLLLSVSYIHRNKSYDVHTCLDENAMHTGKMFLSTVTNHHFTANSNISVPIMGTACLSCILIFFLKMIIYLLVLLLINAEAEKTRLSLGINVCRDAAKDWDGKLTLHSNMSQSCTQTKHLYSTISRMLPARWPQQWEISHPTSLDTIQTNWFAF